jgi:hypothetical protein
VGCGGKENRYSHVYHFPENQMLTVAQKIEIVSKTERDVNQNGLWKNMPLERTC